MNIRSEKFEDEEEIYQINQLAFKRHDESKLIDNIRATDAFIPELSLIAEKNNIIVGHILFSHIHIISRKEWPSLALAPMAVLPAYQKKGIGSALIQEGLKRARAMGYPSVIVLGHKEYYPKFGFEKASKWGIKCPFEVPDESFMAKELFTAALDGKRGVVKYSEVFAQ